VGSNPAQQAPSRTIHVVTPLSPTGTVQNCQAVVDTDLYRRLYSKPRRRRELLAQYSQTALIVPTACLGRTKCARIHDGRRRRRRTRAGCVVRELSRTGTTSQVQAHNWTDSPKLNERVFSPPSELGLQPVMPTNDAHFQETRPRAHDITALPTRLADSTAIGSGCTSDRPPPPTAPPVFRPTPRRYQAHFETRPSFENTPSKISRTK